MQILTKQFETTPARRPSPARQDRARADAAPFGRQLRDANAAGKTSDVQPEPATGEPASAQAPSAKPKGDGDAVSDPSRVKGATVVADERPDDAIAADEEAEVAEAAVAVPVGVAANTPMATPDHGTPASDGAAETAGQVGEPVQARAVVTANGSPPALDGAAVEQPDDIATSPPSASLDQAAMGRDDVESPPAVAVVPDETQAQPQTAATTPIAGAMSSAVAEASATSAQTTAVDADVTTTPADAPQPPADAEAAAEFAALPAGEGDGADVAKPAPSVEANRPATPAPADAAPADVKANGPMKIDATPPRPEPAVRAANVAEQGAEAVVVAARTHLVAGGKQQHQMTLRLDPPSLGSVRVDVRMVDGQLSASFSAGGEVAQRVLQQNLPQLKAGLEQAGFAVDRVSVGRAGPASQPAPQDGGGSQQQGHQHHDQPREQMQQNQRDQQRREALVRMWRRGGFEQESSRSVA